MLLRQLGLVDDILFVHPKDVQDGQVEIGPGDIATNLPYAPDAQLVFDHHSETLRNTTIAANHIIDPDAPRPPGWSTTTTAAPNGSRASRRS